jgi:nitrogen fixation NifU-like protein
MSKEVRVSQISGESAFDRMVEEIQRQIIEDERATYSQKVITEYYNPKNLGRMSVPDAVGIVQGWCGDTMEIYLRMNGSTIREATFMTDGCGPTVACGSKVTAMVRGMSLDEARQVEQVDLVAALDGLPEESLHCAELAVNTLREAISHHEEGNLGTSRPPEHIRGSLNG